MRGYLLGDGRKKQGQYSFSRRRWRGAGMYMSYVADGLEMEMARFIIGILGCNL
jgi:hypothetical protein